MQHPYCIVWLAAGLACGTAAAQQPEPLTPERLTTDTADYCAQLAVRIAAEQGAIAGAAARDVQRLSDSGQKLCAQGLIRGGVAHLRTALRIIHQTRTSAAADSP